MNLVWKFNNLTCLYDGIATNNIVCRISALGIVGDLLKKVGALELKLVLYHIIFQELCRLTKSSICRCPAETLSRRTERKLPIRMDSHLWQLTGPKKFREVHPVRRWKIYVMKIRNSDSRFHRFLGSFHGILWNY